MGSEGGEGEALAPLDFEIISKKGSFFQFRGVKNKFHHFCPPWKNIWENPLLLHPGKILPTSMTDDALYYVKSISY